MKRYLALFMALMLVCLLLPSCGGNRKDNDLYAFDGWWCRPDGYKSDEVSALADIFMINAAEGSLTCYSKYGIASEKYICSASGNIITVDISAIGYVQFMLSGDSLTDVSGEKVKYVKGSPVEAPDLSAFVGKWYRNGDANDNFYVLSENAYEYRAGNMQNKVLHTGSWANSESVRYTENGMGYNEILITVSNRYPSDTYRAEYEYALLCGGIVMYDNIRSEYYIRESDLETEAGIDAKNTMSLISEEWVGEGEHAQYLRFNYYSSEIELVKTVLAENGSVTEETEIIGKWKLDNLTLNIEYNDKSKESIAFGDDSITLNKLALSFTRDEQ
ncbi:MAG: hypothetical protein E7601_05930 [Ruminococcaceae bacterium]|nr:hypothetical protein [Oscillospiraceae bacterium]